MKKIICLLVASTSLFGAVSAAPKESKALVVMSYNIRYGQAQDGSNSWIYRYPTSAMMITEFAPDVIGLQEAVDYQVAYLKEFVEGYNCIGVGREDGKKKGEHMEIFYNKKTVKLYKWGTFWLSETPEVPSKGWGADCIRTATWALFKDKKTGNKFFMVNTHLDHISDEARRNGLLLILDRIAEINPKNYPLVVTGDFNMTRDDPSMKPFAATMSSARDCAVVTDDVPSFNDWGKGLKGKSGKDAIDFIWYKGFGSCTKFETVTKPYLDRKFISDHYPIRAELRF